MDFQNQYAFAFPTSEMPDDQPPATSYPEKPGETGPLNPTPDVPGADAPEVSTGTRIDDDQPAEETDENEVGEIESQNP
ncbi:hypothetical protein LZD49_05645 [Dyadobacter sp. CY261]|uniref:hypothetical protein n=1 Tax=Dyadobacter sp. CY261 TaxID=2907203 RepID=UPI001F15E6DE|nr:hypothetical protein [Dyadobacter sp. CY261]MCF0069944.1 hypothetical protein [Dyadobacter sp. CY261]